MKIEDHPLFQLSEHFRRQLNEDHQRSMDLMDKRQDGRARAMERMQSSWARRGAQARQSQEADKLVERLEALNKHLEEIKGLVKALEAATISSQEGTPARDEAA